MIIQLRVAKNDGPGKAWSWSVEIDSGAGYTDVFDEGEAHSAKDGMIAAGSSFVDMLATGEFDSQLGTPGREEAARPPVSTKPSGGPS